MREFAFTEKADCYTDQMIAILLEYWELRTKETCLWECYGYIENSDDEFKASTRLRSGPYSFKSFFF